MLRFLDRTKSVGLDPAADSNVEEFGICCLDINTRPAELMKGRFAAVWWMLWGIWFSGAIFALEPIRRVSQGGGFGSDIDAILVGMVLMWIGPAASIFFFVRIWRSHLPVRFNRRTRKVYWSHRGRTLIASWDDIRAWISIVATPAAEVGIVRDPILNITFPNQAASTVWLMGTEGVGTKYERAAKLWEYIRVYMEEGPEALPQPVRQPEHDWIGWCRHHTPFPLFPHKTFVGVVLEPVLFPLRAFFFFVNYPTDLSYAFIAKRVKMNPFPKELVEPCECTETATQRKRRVEALLRSYDEQVQGNLNGVHLWEMSLIRRFEERFSRVCSSEQGRGDEEGLPEGWFRVSLGDLVEINPHYNVDSAKEFALVSIQALSDTGLTVEDDRLEQSTLKPGMTLFRNGDTLIPLPNTQLDKGNSVFVDFLPGAELGLATGDFVVLRGAKVSSEIAYCLSKDERLRAYIAQCFENGQFRADLLARFTRPMPPPVLLDSFQNEFAAPWFKRIKEWLEDNRRIKRAKARVLENTGILPDGADR